MNIEVLMSKASACPKPVIGATYLTTNWDDTLDVVKVVEVTGSSVVMEYPDGVRHRVSVLYFFEGASALLVQ